MNVDEQINDYNQKKFKNWTDHEVVTFEVTSDVTGKTINVTLDGDFITCKNCRDKILFGGHWRQGSLTRSGGNGKKP